MTRRTVYQWLITAPQETFEAILDVAKERSHQEDTGWTREHDDELGPEHLRAHALAFVNNAQGDTPFQRLVRRQRMVKAAALLIAAIEVIDRHEPGQTWPLPARPTDG